MTQLSAETYVPGFQARDQETAYDDTRKSRFDAFGELIDTPSVEGFADVDWRDTLAKYSAQMLAKARVAEQEAQTRCQPPVREAAACAYIRANRLMLIRRKLK